MPIRKLNHKEILARQSSHSFQTIPLVVILNNIRSLHNVGSIFRTCDGAGVEKLWLGGITGYPPRAEISKTAIGAEENVVWEHAQDPVVPVRELKSKGYHILALEQTDQSVPYSDVRPAGPVCLIVGNEVEGVSDELIELCDSAADIPMRGVKNSLNAAVAAGIMIYHLHASLRSL